MGKSDIITGKIMDNPIYFADTINNGLFNGKEIVHPENLSELDSTENAIIGDELKKYITIKKDRDIVKNVKILKDDKVFYVIIGIENQTNINYAMPVRVFFYDAMRYAKQVQNITARYRISEDNKLKTREEFLSGMKKNDKLQPVITLTVYYGIKEWDGPLSLHDMFPKDVSSDVLSLVPNYRLHFLSPNSIEDWNSFKTDVGILFEMISVSNKEKGMERLMEKNPEKYKAVDNDIVRAINHFAKEEFPIDEVKETTDMCYAMETTRAAAMQQGMAQIIDLYRWLKANGRDTEAEDIMLMDDDLLLNSLFEEFSNSKNQ